MESEVQRLGINKFYINIPSRKEEFVTLTRETVGESFYDDTNGGLNGYIDRWIEDPSKEHISILGEFGTGKTWFALHYAWVTLQKYKEAKKNGLKRP